jgi:hypothetical protein
MCCDPTHSHHCHSWQLGAHRLPLCSSALPCILEGTPSAAEALHLLRGNSTLCWALVHCSEAGPAGSRCSCAKGLGSTCGPQAQPHV